MQEEFKIAGRHHRFLDSVNFKIYTSECYLICLTAQLVNCHNHILFWNNSNKNLEMAVMNAGLAARKDKNLTGYFYLNIMSLFWKVSVNGNENFIMVAMLAILEMEK